ncbi:MAG TPA: hypothetical protein ENM98_03065 [Halothiobacillaceae bacterium]|nr:hypothetical protein [Halothiobacillaceae bacterium]
MMRLFHFHQASPPKLEVRDEATGRLIAVFDYTQLDRLVAEGKLSVAELLATGLQAQSRLCRKLVLLACARNCADATSCATCPYRPGEKTRIPPGFSEPVISRLPSEATKSVCK